MIDGLRILLVGDESVIAENIKSRFEKLGYAQAGVAPSGADAFAKIAAEKPDFILIYLGLTGTMTGVETAAKIRHDHDLPGVCVAADSGGANPGFADMAEPSGHLGMPSRDNERHVSIQRPFTGTG